MLVTNKEKYIHFCAKQPDIPIFSQPWWLDTVCPDSWDVILIEKNNKIIASFPYYRTRKKKLFTYIGMPPLTQKLGPYIIYDSDKITENKKIEYEHNIYNDIIDKLPICDVFHINFDWKYKNWLPFYWKGFKQTTRYTYILNDIADNDSIMKNYFRNKKNKIKKAESKVIVKYDLPSEDFFNYYSEIIHNRREEVLFSKELFFRLYNAVYAQKAGRVFYCIDNENVIHSIKFIIWDNECAYSILGMRKKEYNTSGGTELLTDYIIKYVSQFVNRYDFEGSMIKGVEGSYRKFGAHQTEYYSVYKCSNPVLRVLRSIVNK